MWSFLPLLQSPTHKIPKNIQTPKSEKARESINLFVDEEMTNSIPAHPFNMRKPNKAIPREHWHVCVCTYMCADKYVGIKVRDCSSAFCIFYLFVQSDKVGEFSARFMQFTQTAVFPGS